MGTPKQPSGNRHPTLCDNTESDLCHSDKSDIGISCHGRSLPARRGPTAPSRPPCGGPDPAVRY
ncbi:hypothetical protein Asp14428_00350 [Actinoplanes sp. NBRC 14428]|nr:hypothetical protein Asp14428_00350 [Actinoplanes sp. NBRC 14428]